MLEVNGVPYKPFPRGGWNVEARLKDMDFAEVARTAAALTPRA